MSLGIYYVVSHTRHHENSTFVIASSKLCASKLVEGEVMHVGDPMDIKEGYSFGGSGWSKTFRQPEYSTQSEEWRSYLAELNLNQGFEDSASINTQN